MDTHISRHEVLNSRLKSIGFKRKENSFIKEEDSKKYILAFTHSTHYEKFVRYYTITAMIDYLDVLKVAKDIDDPIGGFGMNIGHLSEENFFKEWRVPKDSSDVYLSSVISDIVENILKYAIPYFERYSNIQNVIEDMELNLLINHTNISHYLPIMYYLNGEKEKALAYLQNKKNRLRSKSELDNCGDEKYIYDTYGLKPPSETQESREYLMYKDFSLKFEEYMNKEL